MALIEFSLFPALPIELRLKIWAFYMADNRIIEIGWNERIDHFYSMTKNPAALYICKESREEALQKYQLIKVKSGDKAIVRNRKFVLNTQSKKAGSKRIHALDKHQSIEEVNARNGIIDVIEPCHQKARPLCGSYNLTLEDWTKDSAGPKVYVVFCAYIDYDQDTLFLSRSHTDPRYSETHSISYSRQVEFLAHLRGDNMIRSIALTPDDTRLNAISGCLSTMRGLRKLIYVFGDQCCKGIGHHAAVAFEPVVEDALFKDDDFDWMDFCADKKVTFALSKDYNALVKGFMVELGDNWINMEVEAKHVIRQFAGAESRSW